MFSFAEGWEVVCTNEFVSKTILHVLQEPVDIFTVKLLRLEIIICFLKP